MTKLELIRKMYESHKEREAYLDSVPSDIRSGVFDNKYANSLGRDYDLLYKEVLGEDLYEWACWLMYDWTPGYAVGHESQTYVIDSVDAFIDYLREQHGEQ